MSADIETVRVHILDKDYQVACPSAERDGLVQSAKLLDQHMRNIRQGGKVIGLERIAVMAALNIAHDLVQLGQKTEQGGQDMQERIRRLATKLDETVNSYRQMEI